MDNEIDRGVSSTRRTIIVMAFLTPTMLSLGLVISVVIMYMVEANVPQEMKTLAAAAMGYIYGALPGLVKDFLVVSKTTT